MTEKHPHTHLADDGCAGQPEHTLEYNILKDYLAAQYCTLVRRHSYEDFLLVRTLADHHQHAAWEAKCGRTSIARVQMQTLESLHPSAEELSLACRITADPVWALIEWKTDDHDHAIRRLRSALAACSELATSYGHRYLTARRIYLASNVARVYSSLGAREKAMGIATALMAVITGSAEEWPFEDARSLEVPLHGNERLILSGQLLVQRVEANLSHLGGATPR